MTNELDIKQLNRDNWVVNGFNKGVTVTLGLIVKFINLDNRVCYAFHGHSVAYITADSLRKIAIAIDNFEFLERGKSKVTKKVKKK